MSIKQIQKNVYVLKRQYSAFWIFAVVAAVLMVFIGRAFAATEYNTGRAAALDWSRGLVFTVTANNDPETYCAPSDGWVALEIRGTEHGGGGDGGGEYISVGRATLTVPGDEGITRTFYSGSGDISESASSKYVTLFVPKGTTLTKNSDAKVSGVFIPTDSLSDEDKNLLVNGTSTLNGKTVVNGALTADSITTAGKTYITANGINANSQKITNISAGEISAASTDAVNGSQLYETNSTITKIETAYKAADTQLRNSLTDEITRAKAAEKANKDALTSIANNTYTKEEIDAAIAAGGTGTSGTAANAVTYKDKDKTAVQLQGTNGTKISNLAAGDISENSMDAVNGAQLYAEQQKIIENTEDIETLYTELQSNSEATDKNTKDINAEVKNRINADTELETAYKTADTQLRQQINTVDTELQKTAASVITGFAVDDTGRIIATKKDGSSYDVAQLQDYKLEEATLNGKTLVITAKDKYGSGIIEKTVDLSGLEAETVIQNGDTTYKGDDKNVSIQTEEDPEHEGQYITTLKLTDEITDITSITTKADENGRVTRLDKDGLYVKDGTAAITSTAVTVKDSRLTADSLTVAGKTYITADGINGNNQKITNIADGEISATSTDAVNGAQLYAEQERAKAADEALAKQIQSQSDVLAEITSAVTAEETRAISAEKELSEAISSLDIALKDIAEHGTGGGSQGTSKANEDDTNATATGAGATATGYNTEASGEQSTATGYDNKVSGDNSTAQGNNNQVIGDSSIASGSNNNVSGDNASATGSNNNVSGNNAGAYGNNNTIEGDNNFVIGSDVNIPKEISNSVAIGNNSTVTESNVISVGNETEGGQRRIVNVADGINVTDAATVGQLNKLAAGTTQALNTMQNEINSVTGEVREVGAISAALAGLHFMEPSGEEDDKVTAAASYGGYRGESAAAVGVAYKPSPNFMLSASTSVGNTQNAYNAGISYKFGKGNTAQTKASMQKQMKYMNEENKTLKIRLAEMEERLEEVVNYLNYTLTEDKTAK